MSTSIADIMREHGAAPGGFDETVREMEAVKAVLFAFHPWMPLPNFGADTFRFNLHRAVLPRLEPIPLTTVQRPVILPKNQGNFGVMNVTNFQGEGRSLEGDTSGMGGMIASGGGAVVKQEPQRPAETMRDLLSAWGYVGMTPLTSLAAADEAELTDAFVIYEAVMGAARDGEEVLAGRRHPLMPLEEFPYWLAGRDAKGQKIPGALDALSHAMSNGVTRMLKVTRTGAVVGETPKHYDFPRGGEAKALGLIEAVRASVARATDTAIGAQNGVLVKTRRGRQIARNGGGPEARNHYDDLDIFLMQQFPSFDMDTDVERANATLQKTMEKSAEGSGDTAAAMLTLAQQNAKMIELLAAGQAQTQELIGALVKKKPAAGG